MIGALTIAFLVGQPPADANSLSLAERTARLKQLLAPIHLSDPIAPLVKAALERPVSLSFDNAPLPEVVKQLSPLLGGNIRLDPSLLARDEDGKPLPPPTITYHCVNTRLFDALAAMLAEAKVGVRFENEGVEIAELELIRKVLEWRIYLVPDLEAATSDGGLQMLRTIQDTIDEEGWECNGGEGQIINGYAPGVWVVGCDAKTHQDLARFIAAERRKLPDGSPTKNVGVLMFGDPPREEAPVGISLDPKEAFLPALERRLAQRHNFDVRGAAVENAAARLSEIVGVPIKVKARDAKEARYLKGMRVDVARQGITGRAALGVLYSEGICSHASARGIALDLELDDADPDNPARVLRNAWHLYPLGGVFRRPRRNAHAIEDGRRRGPSFYITAVFSAYADRNWCFKEEATFAEIDLPLFAAHALRASRREHRRFEQLHAGLREAARRASEIQRLLRTVRNN